MEIKDGRVFAKGSPEQGLSVTDAVRAHYAKGLPLSGRGRFADDIPRDMDPATGYGDTFPVYSYSCTVATVKVNPMTGDITVLKLVAANDLGQVINRLGAEGQVEGALLQGLGYAHLEEVVLREGKVLNGNFLDYKLPTSLDGCPFELIMVESNEATGPYGAKGVGEAALVPVAPAIANAIYDAVGVRFNDLPFKKERIYGRVKG